MATAFLQKRTWIRATRDDQQATGQKLIVQRLDYFDEETGEWQELIVEARHTTPADDATVRIDFKDWLRTLPRRERRVALKLASGETTSGVAKLFRVTAGRVSQLRRELFDRWQEFQGEPVAA